MCGSRGENARPQINNRRVPRYRSLPHRFVLNQRSHQGCRNREFARAPSTAAGPERDRFQQPHDEAPPSEQTRQIVCVIFVHIVLRYYNRETAWCEGKPPVSTASLSALTLMSTRRLNTMCAPSGKPWLHSSFLAMRYKPRAKRSCVATQTPHEPSAQAIAQQLGKRCIIVRGATASPFEVAIPKRKKKCS